MGGPAGCCFVVHRRGGIWALRGQPRGQPLGATAGVGGGIAFLLTGALLLDLPPASSDRRPDVVEAWIASDRVHLLTMEATTWASERGTSAPDTD